VELFYAEDNTEETIVVTDMEIGWLAGVIDGEGCISISTDKKDNRLHAQVFLTNSNQEMLIKARRIMLELGVENPRLHLHSIGKSKFSHRSNVPCHRIYIGTAVGMRKLLQAIFPQLTSKRVQAELMLEFLKNRKGRSARVRFTGRDFEIAQLIREVNRPIVGSVETVRVPQPGKAEMIQSELYGDMQSEAEMTSPAEDRNH
jgi:LAGLIDADG-like domain